MSDQQRQEHRDLYNYLRKRLLAPGESIAGVRKHYRPVNPLPAFSSRKVAA